ncbi:DUF3024 domain-containing protein [Vibrio astriarenae]|uniref:DUF3024 domain-containing protein n=1 Tax=Vibrio agarivorans TaxID=153622 RepID=A0ABT7Y3I9_9VIBR|nr:DUF3024 domain-containing protein [Vibrio agarivorans]MDN2482603.1 DUF3024 domain-containing protein [Vibrio agarivorans]MDN3660752.1 DUF3024 domain-containing protein [Vibrio agarivorans]
MSLVNLLQRQVETRASTVCHNRNRNLPVDLGVSCFEAIPNGVEFIKRHYLLDSKYSDYAIGVARIIWNHDTSLWELHVPNEQPSNDILNWILYPYLSCSSDLTALIREVEKDPKDYFW